MVITDTSPLNYLILIGAENVLPQLYGQIAVPRAVARELQHAGAPAEIGRWILEPPEWIRIVGVRETGDPALNELGAGEREAIVLALDETTEVLVLMDENLGRSEAKRRNLVTTGTLGVLDAAAAEGLLDLPTAIDKLRKTSFFASPVLFKRLLDRDAARRSHSEPQH
jgi:predicted nucleic acid-binding protein